MSTNAFVNLDARWLFDLAEANRLGRLLEAPESVAARLHKIAERVESMDAKLARHIDGSFAEGVLTAGLKANSKSNVVRQSKIITDSEGEMVIAALERVPVQQLKIGERARLRAKSIDVTSVPPVAARKGWRLEDL